MLSTLSNKLRIKFKVLDLNVDFDYVTGVLTNLAYANRRISGYCEIGTEINHLRNANPDEISKILEKHFSPNPQRNFSARFRVYSTPDRLSRRHVLDFNMTNKDAPFFDISRRSYGKITYLNI